MIRPGVSVWVATSPVDMRKSFDGLADVVRAFLGHDPLSGSLFVFRNRSAERVKILWWDRDGLAICYKRLERGTFQFPSAGGGKRAAQMLRLVQLLYAVEDRIKRRLARRQKQNPKITTDERHQIIRQARQSRSTGILAKIKTWLDSEQQLVLPRSPMAAAITYTLNQWTALCAYTTQGFLNIDNNAAERALKRVAIGRKNWLFAGNDHAGQSHARLYTLIAGAERHGLDPQKYLMSVLARIGATPMSELDQFLPDQWKAEDAGEAAALPSIQTSTIATSW